MLDWFSEMTDEPSKPFVDKTSCDYIRISQIFPSPVWIRYLVQTRSRTHVWKYEQRSLWQMSMWAFSTFDCPGLWTSKWPIVYSWSSHTLFNRHMHQNMLSYQYIPDCTSNLGHFIYHKTSIALVGQAELTAVGSEWVWVHHNNRSHENCFRWPFLKILRSRLLALIHLNESILSLRIY